MNRLLVALLSALDALVAVAVGLAASLAPLTLLWSLGLPGDADWGALWPTAVRIWQAGHLVPLEVHIDAQYATDVGIPADGTGFVLSLAPLAFAVFTALFAARSGLRAARAGAWAVGAVSGTAVVALLALLAALSTTRSAVDALVSTDLAAAVLLPAAVYGVPALGAAACRAWRDGDGGLLDRVRERLDLDPTTLAASARGAAAGAVGLVGVGAAVLAVAVAVGAGRILALFEAAHVDLVGAIVVAAGQLLYLPAMIVWGAAYAAGPGFAVGVGTAVSPGGTALGVVPGIPVLGAIPEQPSPWLLLLALAVVAVGALAGAVGRARLRRADADGSWRVRLVVWGAIALASAASAALLAVLASGGIGPERLQQVGPSMGAFALAVGLEVAVGAGAVLWAPRNEDDAAARVARESAHRDLEDHRNDDGAAARAMQEAAAPRGAERDTGDRETEDLGPDLGLFRPAEQRPAPPVD